MFQYCLNFFLYKNLTRDFILTDAVDPNLFTAIFLKFNTHRTSPCRKEETEAEKQERLAKWEQYLKEEEAAAAKAAEEN